MILTLVGVSRGMLNASAQRAQGVGADVIVRAAGASVISVSSAPIPEKLMEFFEKQPHVKIATGSIVHSLGGIKTMSGIDLPKFERMSGGFRYVEGHGFRDPYDMIVDSQYAQQDKLKLGQVMKIANHDWKIVGIVEPGKLSRVFVPIRSLQEIESSPGKVTQIFLKLDNPDQVDAVVAQLKATHGLEDFSLLSMRDFISAFQIDNIPELRTFIRVIICLSVVIGFFVVSITMYTAVLERTREIGILKALGASPGFILRLLTRETILLAFFGTVVGVLLTFLARLAILRYIPASMTQEIVPDWWGYALAMSIVAALLGSLYPGMKAARQDAIEALSYE